MTIKDQVCSFPLAEQLNDLGVMQDSLFWWVQIGGVWDVRIAEKDFELQQLKQDSRGNIYSAFTVAELGEMLPSEFSTFRLEGDTRWHAENNNGTSVIHESIEADARAKMLIYLLENALIAV